MPQPNNSLRGRPSRQAVYARLGSQIGELRDRLGGLPSSVEAEGIWRGLGNKELGEYLEVRGYANAADWVYGHAIAPDDWAGHGLITLTELRHVHQLTMTPVWNVAPHPQATDREGPGSFREHDIQPFPEGMTPPS